MQAGGTLLAGVGAGAAIAYLLDPDCGARRRGRVRDLARHAARLGRDAAGATLRDVRNRAYGAAEAVSASLDRDAADDRVVAERVRALLGRLVSHPHAIDVTANGGQVVLSGPLLKAEVKPLLRAVRRTRGVRGVVDYLEPHKAAGNVPSLQGGRPRAPRRDARRNWSPTTRLFGTLGGAALVGYGASRRDVPGLLVAAGGAGVMARAASNLKLVRLTGVGAGRRAVDIQKTITIAAPVADVFAFWTCYENFPRFMSRVLDVRPSSREGRSHWTVAGPAGVPVEFDSQITTLVPNEVLGWRTVAGSAVEHAGLVRFDPDPTGGTRVSVRMSYNPPGGSLGHGVAAAFGVDPKSSLDEDLARLKTLIETGRPPHDAARRDVA
jgi:uncharacterized membrane protein